MSDRQNLDPESRIIILQGASTNQLGAMFRMKPADVLGKLAGLQPVGTGRQGNPIYAIRDAAERLIKIQVPPEVIEATLKRMNPKDLPPMLNRLFWDGLAAEIRYKRAAGELWNTEEVMAVAALTFQSLRTSLLLISDTLRDETSLDDRQVVVVQNIIDNGLETARAQLIEDLRKSDDGPGPSAEEGDL